MQPGCATLLAAGEWHKQLYRRDIENPGRVGVKGAGGHLKDPEQILVNELGLWFPECSSGLTLDFRDRRVAFKGI